MNVLIKDYKRKSLKYLERIPKNRIPELLFKYERNGVRTKDARQSWKERF